jgi:diguanylate cyclase (GGDEF)-like protein
MPCARDPVEREQRHQEPIQLRTESEAIHAVARLLGLAMAHHGATPVQEGLATEARRLFDAEQTALIALGPEARRPELVATGGVEASRRIWQGVSALPGFPELVERQPHWLRLGGEDARRLAGQIGLDIARAGVMLLLPMRSHDSIDYVLVIAHEPQRTLSDADVDVAVAFATGAAAALAQLHLGEEHAEQVAQQSALARAAATLNESLDPQEVLTRICQEAAAILDADNAAVYRGAPGEGATMEAIFNIAPECLGYKIPPGGGLSGKVVESGEAMLTNDYQREGTPAPDSPFRTVRACLSVPMHWDGRLHGALSVGYTRPHHVTDENLRLLSTFAELAAVACRNATAHAGLAQAARTDGLTGCLNHAALHEALRSEIERCERTGHALSIVLVDLDGFKRVNEEHGHLVGDEVLRRVGFALRQAVRPYDLVARYGGDEFAILAVESGEQEAAEIARRAVDRLDSALGEVGRAGATRATAGVAEWTPRTLSAEELIDRADRALLIGKRDGMRGNIVEASSITEADLAGATPGRPDGAALPSRVTWPEAGSRQEDRLRKRTLQLSLANKLGTRLSAMTDPAEIFDAVVEELHRALGYHLCSVIRVREDNYVEAAAGRGEAFVRLGEQNWCQPRTAGVIGRCLRERRVVLVNDIRKEPSFIPTAETPDVLAELCAPLWVGDELWGAINVEEPRCNAFDEDDARLVETVSDMVGSALRSAMLYERLERGYLGTAEALATALEAKDSYTAEHARSIVGYSEAVGRRLGLSEDEIRDLRYGAALHDIGKIAVPEAILNKRGPLDADELEIIFTHTVVGEQILAPIEFLGDVLPLVRHEHERWDGSGYPDGLAGDEIPLGSRIIFVCDAFHAMTSDRPYRKAMSRTSAREELERGGGSQFDPRVVEVFLEILAEEDAETVVPEDVVATDATATETQPLG